MRLAGTRLTHLSALLTALGLGSGCGGGSGGGGDCTPITTPQPAPNTAQAASTLSTLEAEIAIAADRYSPEGWVYVATIEAILAPIAAPVTYTQCITEKQVRVYRSKGGQDWELVPGSVNLGTAAALGGTEGPLWVTDPWLDVASDGTLFVSVLHREGSPDCATPLPAAAGDIEEHVQVWAFDPAQPAVGLTQLAVDPVLGFAPISQGAVAAGDLDHPRMAVNPTNPGQVVVTYLVLNASMADQVRTLHRDAVTGVWTIANTPNLTQLPTGTDSFANPAFDALGNLYIAHSPVGTTGPVVNRYSWTGADWSAATSGTVPLSTGTVLNTTTNNMNLLGRLIPIDPTPAMVITGATATAAGTVHLAYTVNTNPAGGIVPAVRLASGDAGTLAFGTPVAVGSVPSFAQSLGVDATTDVLDVAYLGLADPSGTVTTDTAFNTFLERRSAANLATLAFGPLAVGQTPPVLTDWPARSPTSTRAFPGEYLAVTTFGSKAYLAWPEVGPGGGTYLGTTTPIAEQNVDLGNAVFNPVAGCVRSTSQALSAASGGPDSIWECDCSCGGLTSNMVGCVPAGTADPAAACEYVCLASDCGLALTCGATPRECVPLGTGRAVMNGACGRAFGPAAGAQPSLFADYYAEVTDGSATFHFDGESASTAVRGAISFNADTTPPAAGTVLELARLQVWPSSFDVGGFLGARVDSIVFSHAERLRGYFTDPQHFVIPEGAGEFVVRFRIDPDGPSWFSGDPDHEQVIGTNTTPITGTVDLAAGTVTLNLAFGDANEGFNAALTAVLTAAPLDTDDDGVVDAVDNCPLLYNPDQHDDPPVFAAVDDATILRCNPGDEVLFEAPVATDECTPEEIAVEGVITEINGVAQDPGLFLADNLGTLPSGSLVVQWTATDGNGHSVVEVQHVELLSRPTLYANGTLSLADRSRVVVDAVRFGTIDNGGTGLVDLGVETAVGDVLGTGDVNLRDRAMVNGWAKSGGEVSLGADAEVAGTIEEWLEVVHPEFPSVAVTFPPAGESIDLQPGQSRSLTPGSFGSVTVKTGATLTLSAGSYFFTALDLEPDGTVVLDKTGGDIRLFVQDSLVYRGRFTFSDGSPEGFYLAFLGAAAALEAPFQGPLVAPNATLTLGALVPMEFLGEFYAKDIVVRPDTTVLHHAFDCTGQTTTGGSGTQPTCADGVTNGTETGTDCGGDTCEPCADGQPCNSSVDCVSTYCDGGVCATATCTDLVMNQDESDTDCGGACGATCAPGEACNAATDCTSGVCVMGLCQAPPGACHEANAVDLGEPGHDVTTPNDGCVMVKTGYPSWWAVRHMMLQNTAGGTYPVPFTWTSACTGAGGSGLMTGEWQSFSFGPTSMGCATLIDLAGTGGSVTLRYYAN